MLAALTSIPTLYITRGFPLDKSILSQREPLINRRFPMNERNSIQELLNQLTNSEHWVKRIAAAYLGVRPEQVVITVKGGDAE